MRAVFGVVSLLVVLGVVALTARQQLRAVAPAPAAAAGPAASRPATPAQATQQLQQQIRRDIDAAAREGAARNEAAEKDVK